MSAQRDDVIEKTVMAKTEIELLICQAQAVAALLEEIVKLLQESESV